MLKVICGRLYTGEGRALKGKALIIEGKKFLEIVGRGEEIGGDCKEVDFGDRVIIPGLIDSHTHLGIKGEGIGEQGADHNETSGQVNPGLRVIDGINPQDPGFTDAFSGGITTVLVVPGSETVIGGQAAAVKTFGTVIDSMVIRKNAGLKVAFGETPKKTGKENNQLPQTRMGISYLLRRTFHEVKSKEAENQELDLNQKALFEVLEGNVPLIAHAHRADDIVSAVRLKEELKIDLVVHHGTAAHSVADYLEEKEVPVVVGPLFTSRLKEELNHRSYETANILSKKGIKFSFMTDHPILPVNLLRLQAAVAVKEGLDKISALEALTSRAADILGISDRVGRIEKGKDADFVVISGKPFSVDTIIEHVYINGEKVYDIT